MTYPKKIRLGAALAVCALLGAGCGGAAASPASSQPARQEEALGGTLTVYLEKSFADDTLVNYPIRQALDAFRARYPQVELELVSPVGGVSDGEARQAQIEALNTQILAGGGPDVFLFGPRFTSFNLFPDMEKAMQNGAFLECGELLGEFGIDCAGGDFWPGMMEAGQWEGGQYILPLSFDLLLCLADRAALEEAGFESGSAGSTGEFLAELERVSKESGAPACFCGDLTSNLALPMLDEKEGKVNLDTREAREMLEAQKRITQGVDFLLTDGGSYVAQVQQLGMTGYRKEMARQLAEGELLLYIDDFEGLIDLARVMEGERGGEIFLPLPNERGGVTAQIQCWSAISANTQNPRAAAALIAFLLDEGQDMGAYPSTLDTLPVRRSSLEPALEALLAHRQKIWWLDPTEEQQAAYEELFGVPLAKTQEEKEEWLEGLGQDLGLQALGSLESVLGQIDGVHLQSLWVYSVDLGKNPDGDSLLNEAYREYLGGRMSLDELIDTLTPRLELYLDE